MNKYLSLLRARSSSTQPTILSVEVSGDIPGYAYTVGLAPRLHELLVFGLPTGAAHTALKLAARRLRREHPNSLDRLAGVLQDREVMLLPAFPSEHEPLTHVGASIHKSGEFLVDQLVWPDALGRWPWDTGFTPDLGPMQPLIAPPPDYLVDDEDDDTTLDEDLA